MCGKHTEIKYCPLPQDDPKQRQPNIARAQELLKWQPTIQLREGLARTVAYFSKRVRADSPSDESAESFGVATS
jgi:UDP-glucuronate decarboxylase